MGALPVHGAAPEAGARAPSAGLAALLAAALAALGLLAWAAPDAVPLVAGALAGLGLLVAVGRAPRVRFALWLGSAFFLLSSEPGLQVTEVLGALYFFGYCAAWYGSRLLLYRSRLVYGLEDRLWAVLLPAGIVGGVALGLLYGANPTLLVGEFLGYLLVLAYFPVRERCRHDPRGVGLVLGALIVLGVAVSLDNVRVAHESIADATQVWQIINVRAVRRELLLALTGLLTLALLPQARGWLARGGLGLLFAIQFGGLILTKSRAYWVAFVVGICVLVLLQRGRERRQLVGLLGAGLVAAVGAAFALVGPYATLIVTGALNRIGSLGSTGSDVSLINRFVETHAVMEQVWANPILGHGFGVEFSYYSLIVYMTVTGSYNHNGYVAVWYKFGLWGVALYALIWGRALWCAWQAGREPALPAFERAAARGVAATLAMLVLPTYVTTVFFEDDKVFAFAVAAALAGGLYQRGRLLASRAAPPARGPASDAPPAPDAPEAPEGGPAPGAV